MQLLKSKPLWAAVLTLTGIAVYRAQRPGVMTKELDALYRRCLNGQVKSTAQLREYANQFERARLFPQAHLLRQRADLRDLPPEVKAHRREIFRKGMRSKNKAAVLKLADGFDSQGATTSAYRLRQYASGLPDLDSNSFEPVVTPPPEEPGERDQRDTEPAPADEKPIQTPVPPESRPETPPGPPASELNGKANHAAAAE